MSKLTSYGVNGIELEWFRAYLCNCKVQIVHNKYFYGSKPLFSGVPQGSILGHLLFVIFSNDVVLELNQSKIINNSDDTIIFFTDKYYDKVERALCGNMNRSQWFTENKLLLNLKPGKTELLVFAGQPCGIKL